MELNKKQKKILLKVAKSLIRDVKRGVIRFSARQKKSKLWEELQ